MARMFGDPRTIWSELERLRDEMDSVYRTYRRRARAEFPALNVWTSEDKAVVTAELPGVCSEDIDVSVVGATLTLRGERKREESEARYHRRERGAGAFTRTIELPFAVDNGAVEASLERGVLRVTLPRAEQDKPRKIAVKAG